MRIYKRESVFMDGFITISAYDTGDEIKATADIVCSGKGFKTRNSCHKLVCDTKERLSYYPMLGQQIFDTDLNKMLICIDPATKKWVDFNGNEA